MSFSHIVVSDFTCGSTAFIFAPSMLVWNFGSYSDLFTHPNFCV